MKIFLAVFLSLVITIFIGNNFFLGNTPHVNTFFLSSIPRKIENLVEKTTISPTPWVTYEVGQRPGPTGQNPTPTSFFTTKIVLSPILSLTQIPILIPTAPYSPLPTSSPSITCPQTSDNSYDSLDVINVGDNRPAQDHPDKNIHIRGYKPTGGNYNLIDLEGGVDTKGPRFSTLLNQSEPKIISLYQVYDWDWNSNSRGGLITKWPVTLIGLMANPGDSVSVPDSGYDVSNGNDVIVLFADDSTVTLKYTREDSVAYGYTIHIDGICVDPNLLALYNQLNQSGRGQLPTLKGRQPVGVAKNNEVKVAIRDTGEFLEPRSRKDWW